MKAVSELGNFIAAKKSQSPLSILVHPIKNPGPIFAIVLEKEENNSFNYIGISTYEYSSEQVDRYLYRRGSSRGANITLAGIITDLKNPQKSFDMKIINWFRKKGGWKETALTDYQLTTDEVAFLEGVYQVLDNNREKIVTDIKDTGVTLKTSQTNRKKNVTNILLTIIIKDGSKEFFIGEYSGMQKWLKSESKTKYSDKYNSKSLGTSICYLCKEKKEVCGFVSDIFPFYTMDKYTFASGLDVTNAWKNYPVCFNCALSLELGKKYLEKNLQFTFYGFKYFLIPKFILPPTDELIDEVLTIFETKNIDKVKVDQAATTLRRITDDENEILELLSNEPNYLSLTFLFYNKPQSSQMVIDAVIPDILPSRLQTLYQAKEFVDGLTIDKPFINEEESFSFKYLREIFPSAFNKSFLEMVKKIFIGVPIEENFIISQIMRTVRMAIFDSNGRLNLPRILATTIEGFLLLHFMNYLGVLKYTKKDRTTNNYSSGGELMPTKTDYKQLGREINNFFEENSHFFNHPAKKACFLSGVLTKRLLDIQYQERQSRPFWNKLNGLHLGEKQIKSLFPKIVQKLKEYNANYPSFEVIEELIGQQFIEAGDSWKLPDDVTSFCFVVGMTQSYKFMRSKEEPTEE